MSTVYVFFAGGFEETEIFTSVDVMRRIGLKAGVIAVILDEIMTSVHDVPMLCDKNIMNCDSLDTDLVVLLGGMSGTATSRECNDLRKLIARFAEENKPIAAICATPTVLGKPGLLKGRKAACYPGFDNFLEGTEYIAAMVGKDGNIITGRGPGTTMEFALAMVELLQGKDEAVESRKAIIV